MLKESPSSSRPRVIASSAVRSASPTVKKSALCSATPRNASSSATKLRNMDEGNLPLQSTISRPAASQAAGLVAWNQSARSAAARDGKSSSSNMSVAQKSRLKSQGKAMKESTSPPLNKIKLHTSAIASAVSRFNNQVAERNVDADREKPKRINYYRSPTTSATRRDRAATAIRAKRRGCYVSDLQTRRRPISTNYYSRGGGAIQTRLNNINPPHRNSDRTSSLLMDLEEYLKDRASSAAAPRVHAHAAAGQDMESSPCSAHFNVDPQTRALVMKKNHRLFYASEYHNKHMHVRGSHIVRTLSADAEEANAFERSGGHGCGFSLHWPSTCSSDKNDQSLLHYASGCFSGSRRRKLQNKFNCARSLSSSCHSSSDDAELMAPLMTEPELCPHDYSGTGSSAADSAASTSESQGSVFQQQHGAPADLHCSSNTNFFRDDDRSETGSNKIDHIPAVQLLRKQRFDAIAKHRSISAKYRPRKFKDLLGQSMVTESLTNAVTRGKIAPLYLFHGPRGTGKTCAAKIFTCAMNCLSIVELRPCGLCRACLSFNAGANYDVKEVDAAGNSSVESMRVVLKHLCLPPTSSRYKVFIMEDCHMLKKDAWNALLKSLEDPPEHAVVILITTNLEELPRSTISRCQKFMFARIKDSDIVLRLRDLAGKENIDIDADAVHFIAGQSDGSFRDAETMLDQLSLLGKRVTLRAVREMMGLIPDDELFSLLASALSSNSVRTVDAIRELTAAGFEPLALVSQLAALITDVLAGRCNVSSTITVRRDLQGKLQKALRILSDLEKQLRSCNDRATWLTAAFVQLANTESFSRPSSSRADSAEQMSPAAAALCHGIANDKDAAIISMSSVGVSRRHSWGGKERDPFLLEYDSGEALARHMDACDIQNSGVFADKKAYPRPCDPSPHTAGTSYEVLAADRASPCPPGNIDGSTSSKATIMSPSTMENIWRKVLQSCHSLNLKQLLQAEGRLISLSVTEEFAIVKLEFRSCEHKAMAEKATESISKAFRSALFCPVKMEMSLCQQQLQGNMGSFYRRVEDNRTHAAAPPLLDYEEESSTLSKSHNFIDQKRGSMMPSPPPPGAGYETDSKVYRTHILNSSEGCIKDHPNNAADPLFSRSVEDDMKLREKRNYYWNHESRAEDMDGAYSSDSEIGERYVLGGLLCWKATRSKDDKQAHHVLGRRRTRFLVRFVPCAKEEEEGDHEDPEV